VTPRRSPLDDIVVSVPARTEYLHVLRATLTSACALVDLTIDGIDDLRLALDEAAGWLVSLRGSTSLTMRVRCDEDRVEARISVDAPVEEWPPRGFETTVPWQILSAVVDHVSFEPSPEGPAVRIVKQALTMAGGS
jgi:serine/threonine-protein kinase RsbW